MKKRFILFFLVLSLCATCGLTQVVALESQTSKYDSDIKSVVTAYLEDSVSSPGLQTFTYVVRVV